MKKLVSLVAVMCFASACHAAWWDKDTKKEEKTTTITTGKDAAKKTEQAPVNVIKGLVVAINIPQNEVVVKDEKTLIDKVLIVKPEMYKAFKVGDAVEVKVKAGSTAVENIKVTKAASVEKKIEKAKGKKK